MRDLVSSDLRKCIYAFSYPGISDPFFSAYRRLGDELALRNVTLDVFLPWISEAEANEDYRMGLHQFEMFLCGYRAMGFLELTDLDFSLALGNAWLLDVDRSFGGPPSSIEDLVRCFGYWRVKLLGDSPGLVLRWGSTATISCVVDILCRRLGVKTLAIEKGFFSGTLMVEPLGQGALSWLNFENYDIAYGRAVEAPHADLLRSKYPSKENAEPFSEENGRKKLLVMGDYSPGAGTTPLCSPYARLNSNGISSPRELLSFILKVADANEFKIFFQKHPLDTNSYEDFGQMGVSIISGYDPLFLVANTDVLCVSMSTVQYISLLVGKPIFLFGNSQLRNKKVSIEIESELDLRQALEKIKKGEYSVEMISRGQAFVHYILKHFLYEYKDDIGAQRFTCFSKMVFDFAYGGYDRCLKLEDLRSQAGSIAESLKHITVLQDKITSLESDVAILEDIKDSVERINSRYHNAIASSGIIYSIEEVELLGRFSSKLRIVFRIFRSFFPF